MTNYVWVIEIKKNREYIPFSVRKTQAKAELVKKNNEKLYPSKFRVKRYLREKNASATNHRRIYRRNLFQYDA